MGGLRGGGDVGWLFVCVLVEEVVDFVVVYVGECVVGEWGEYVCVYVGVGLGFFVLVFC